ncbi:hypothetical protein PTTG_09145 [Puccinia triticina 1-1 BBBD Race 1]|uniref:Uncharacterized protein n=1 Tax=Puccinia triticina (isolate 1-1 / race 1 (BBBD)) TaxID=630390 RepID=A0A0C4F7L1_PUCT1|nr:hypothetical protein PTTG_09145 [Puccinia triticina 1-1 BBBD Race 1]WAR59826.1 hypothetical protein PtB15_11B467 [Puccinia triticina]
MKPKNGRLGHMGHLILIGDEVLKALENNPEEFEMIGRELETNERWKAFVRGPIDEAREHAKLPLGGVMPVMAGGLLEGTVAPATDEVESSLLSASTSSPPGSTGEGSSSILVDGSGKDSANGKGKKVAQGRTKKGEGFARYLVEQISVVRSGADKTDAYSSSSSSSSSDDDDDDDDDNDDQDGGKSSDEAEKSARVPANKAPPPSLSPQPKHADYDDDQWDSSRASDPSNFRSSILSDPTDAAGFPKMAPSIISNPTPFGFDDRFDASVRSFPQPFQEDFDLSEGDGQQPGGFDDDFGALQEAEMPAGGSTSAKRGTPRPGTAPYHPQGSAVRLPASSGEETGQEEEEWGEFAGPSPAITLTPSPNTSVPQNPALHDDDEDRWNDFDLLVDQSKSLALNHPSPTPPPPSSPGPP